MQVSIKGKSKQCGRQRDMRVAFGGTKIRRLGRRRKTRRRKRDRLLNKKQAA